MSVLAHLGGAVTMSAGMAWQTAWSLVLGFTLSALLQSTVRSDDLRRALGRGTAGEVALATAAGAASSSCSYASAALMRTLFKKGAALVCALAFMIASTNLVLELGLILLVLLGWKFMLGQWVGGVVMIAIMALLVRATAPRALLEAARASPEQGGHHHASSLAEGATWWARVRHPQTRVLLARSFAMEWRMLWKDLAVGFLVGGVISAFVPNEVWRTVFLGGHSGWLAVPVDALVGAVLAIVTFVCSVGNVPLAAILWAGGASFAGVLSFIYADLVVVPLLDTYRRYFGWRFAAYLFAVLFASMVLAAIVVDAGFAALHLAPPPNPDVRAEITSFSLNYTFWLNLVMGAWALLLFLVARRNPERHAMACHGSGSDDHHGVGHEGHSVQPRGDRAHAG